MLSAIREKAKGWIAWLIVTLISIPFALWGINSYFEALAKIIVAEVGGIEIDGHTYQQALTDQRQALQQATGGRVDPEILNGDALKQQVLDGMIGRLLLTQDADAQGYRISDAQLKELIQTTNEFQRDGRFAPDLYELALRRWDYSVTAFEQRLRQQNTIQQVKNGFVESVFITKTDRNRMARLWQQKRRVSYMQLKPGRFKQAIVVPVAEIEAHYLANKSQYQVPEQVRIEYVRLAVDDLTKDIELSEAQLQQAYEENMDRYTIPEERRASHILVKVKRDAGPSPEKNALEKATSLSGKARSGADFAKLAREHSADTDSASRGGDLDYLSRGITEKVLEDTLFKLKVGEVSAPVRSSFGYHVLKLTGIKPKKRKPFESVRAQLMRELKRKQAEEHFLDLSETFRDLVYENPDSFAPVAEALSLKIRQSEWFSRKGGKDLTSNPRVIAAAFSEEVLTQKKNSETIETDIDTLIALRVIGHREPKVKPLEAVYTEIERQLKVGVAREQAIALGKEMLVELRGGKSLQQVSGRRGIKIHSPGLVGRGKSTGIEARIIRAVFKANRPKENETVFGGVDLGDAGYAVFALKEIVEGDAAITDDAVRKGVNETLQLRRGLEYYLNYQQGLRNKAEIVIHADKL